MIDSGYLAGLSNFVVVIAGFNRTQGEKAPVIKNGSFGGSVGGRLCATTVGTAADTVRVMAQQVVEALWIIIAERPGCKRPEPTPRRLAQPPDL